MMYAGCGSAFIAATARRKIASGASVEIGMGSGCAYGAVVAARNASAAERETVHVFETRKDTYRCRTRRVTIKDFMHK